MVSGFITSVSRQSNRRQQESWAPAGKYVVRASVRHSPRINDDPLVNTDMHHLRKRWDYFVSPLLLMQSWTGWLAYRECFILFGDNYTNS